MNHTSSCNNNENGKNFGNLDLDLTVAEDLDNWSFPTVAGETLSSLGDNYYFDDDDEVQVNFGVTLPTNYLESSNKVYNDGFALGYSSRDSLFSVELDSGENNARTSSNVAWAWPRAESYNCFPKLPQQFQHPTYNASNNMNDTPPTVMNIPELTGEQQIMTHSNINIVTPTVNRQTALATVASLEGVLTSSPDKDRAVTINATSGVSPSPERDVIFGRGQGPATHIGNQAFRHFTMKYKERYVSSKKQSMQATGYSKMMLTCRIYEAWVGIGGRFVEKICDSKGYKYTLEVPKNKCMKKIGMALRQKENWKRVEANDKAKYIALEADAFMGTFSN